MTAATKQRRRRPSSRVSRVSFPLVDRAIVGDRVTLPDLKNRFIVSRCRDGESAMLGCLSCRQPLANLLQLLFHLEGAPHQTHVITRQCREHGWEAL